MASQGPNSTGTVADDASGGATTWGTPSNATASDNSYATNVMTVGQTSHYLKCTNFSFTIPAGATIDGIIVEHESKGSAGSSGGVIQLWLLKAGALNAFKSTSDTVTTSDVYYSNGSSSDLWGVAWTASDINNSGFGVSVVAQAHTAGYTHSVDHVRITVHYTEASGAKAFKRALLGVGV